MCGCYIIRLFHLCIIYHYFLINSIESVLISSNDEWTLEDIIPQGYMKKRPPKNLEGQATVNVSLSLNQILSVDEAEQVITMEFYYHQTWTDNRLKASNDSKIILDGSYKDKLWIPSLYFADSLEPKPIEVTSDPLYIELSEDGHISLSSQIKIALVCKMDLFRFPQDSQECSIDMACVTVSNRSVNFLWDKFTVNETAYSNKFEITGYSYEYCHTYRGPQFPCLRAKIKLFRRISYYALRIYGPSCLLVITALCGFWVPLLEYSRTRVLLVVTPMLSLITQQTQINSEINVSYLVAIHLWMAISITFVFLCLIEYCLAIKYCQEMKEKKEHCKNGINFSLETSALSHFIKILLIKFYGDIDWSKEPLDRNKIDYISRIIFPILYVIFVFIYLAIFLFPWLGFKYS